MDRKSNTEIFVRDRFKDFPELVEIARCESRFRQFDENGDVLRGRENIHDIGVLQINETYHRAAAEALGFDIDTLEGNMSYGIELYKRHGSAPWFWSRGCWHKGQ